MTETELRDAYGMGRHERRHEFRQYEDGEGCSCGKEWGHERRQHTPSDPEPGCEFCAEAAE